MSLAVIPPPGLLISNITTFTSLSSRACSSCCFTLSTILGSSIKSFLDDCPVITPFIGIISTLSLPVPSIKDSDNLLTPSSSICVEKRAF